MALAITRVAGADYVAGNKKHKVRDLVFSGSYAAGGESLGTTARAAANAVGLTQKIEQVQFHGPVRSTDLTGATTATYNHATGKIVHYESAATGLPMVEKGAEAYVTGANVRATFIGF